MSRDIWGLSFINFYPRITFSFFGKGEISLYLECMWMFRLDALLIGTCVRDGFLVLADDQLSEDFRQELHRLIVLLGIFGCKQVLPFRLCAFCLYAFYFPANVSFLFDKTEKCDLINVLKSIKIMGVARSIYSL